MQRRYNSLTYARVLLIVAAIEDQQLATAVLRIADVLT